MTKSYKSSDASFYSSLKVAIPLMISSLSTILMVTMDRIMLSNYDIMAMNAVAVVGALVFAFDRAFTAVAAISEVFVGQFNGAGEFHKAPIATWQMIFFSIASLVILIPVSIFAGPYVIPTMFFDYGIEFFQILVLCIFLASMFAAVAGFFVGTKQTSIIAITSLVSNVINIILNYFLIFGVEGTIPAMGPKGAAIGTAISLTIQFCIIFLVFLSKKQNDKYKTRIWYLDVKIMLSAFKIGVPNSISYMMNILSSYAIMLIVSDTGAEELVTGFNICVNFNIFVFFTSDGIQKAMIGIGSNLLGAKHEDKIKSLIISGIKMQCLCLIFIAIPAFLYMDNIIGLYTNDQSIYEILKTGLPWVILYYFVDGILWVFGCVLISGGDTKFTTFCDIFFVWSTRVLPLYILHNNIGLDIATIWQISSLASFIMTIVFIPRFAYGKWNKLQEL
ncbi:MAG: MATE family efflux transporter [Rickettsiaceae bacterium]|nr:MATE family efflux transporter [Rickettsiaceae bacterium]